MGAVFLGLNLGLVSGYGAGVISVSPAAFRPYDHYLDSLNWYVYSNEAYYDSGYMMSGYMEAPVFLPHLATVTGFTAVVTDNGANVDDEILVFLRRQNLTTGVRETLALVYTTSSFASSIRQILNASSIAYAAVDNENYSYSILVRFYTPHNYLRFHGAKVHYWSVL